MPPVVPSHDGTRISHALRVKSTQYYCQIQDAESPELNDITLKVALVRREGYSMVDYRPTLDPLTTAAFTGK